MKRITIAILLVCIVLTSCHQKPVEKRIKVENSPEFKVAKHRQDSLISVDNTSIIYTPDVRVYGHSTQSFGFVNHGYAWSIHSYGIQNNGYPPTLKQGALGGYGSTYSVSDNTNWIKKPVKKRFWKIQYQLITIDSCKYIIDLEWFTEDGSNITMDKIEQTVKKYILPSKMKTGYISYIKEISKRKEQLFNKKANNWFSPCVILKKQNSVPIYSTTSNH